MEIEFQHTNPNASHESTLLHISSQDSETRSYLIDAGDGVSPTAFLGKNDSLDGVFLTHAHKDHYASLSQVLSTFPSIPLYTSPTTATILDQIYTEADKYQDLGDVTPITEALTPIDEWTPIDDGIYVLPVPAGHTPGAVGFLFRIDDPQHNETVTILITGDFTLRPAAGYPGLSVPGSIDLDVIIVNAATSSDFTHKLNESLETIIERALGGATTLVATGALTGVHIAYLLGHLLNDIEGQLPIHLAGQAAKLYTQLEYDVPFVTVHPQFAHTDEVLSSGAITIAGPEAPIQGSAKRLYGVIENDPDALFVQLVTSGSDAVSGATCATHYTELSNHPTEQQIIDFIETNLPRHLIFKHTRPDQGKALGETFGNLFHWSNDDTHTHKLYDRGDWTAPHWVDEGTASRIRRRNYQQSGSRLLIDRPIDDLPTVELDRQKPTLSSEGIDLAEFEERFKSKSTAQISKEEQGSSLDEENPSVSSTEGQSTNGPSVPMADADTLTELMERIETVETVLDDLKESVPTEPTLETGLETFEERLDKIDTKLEQLPDELESDDFELVQGTVLRHEELTLIRVETDALADLDSKLEHQQKVELKISGISEQQE